MSQITIPDETPKAVYTVGSTPQSLFTFDFAYTQASDIVVTVDGVTKTLTTDYTVAPTTTYDDGFDGGTVTMVTAVSNATVVVSRSVPVNRTTLFPLSGPFSISSLNTELGRIVMMVQDNDPDLRKALRFSLDITDNIGELNSNATTRAGGIVGFDTSGLLTIYTLSALGTLALPVSVLDNEVPRWDGTGGLTLQTSGVTINDSGNLTLPGALAPGDALTTRANIGVPAGVLVKSANYTVAVADRNKLLRFTATATASLPAAATAGADWIINIRADGGVVTVDPNGAELIDGASSLTLQDGEAASIWCDGSSFTTMKGAAGGGYFKGSGTDKGAGNTEDIFRVHSSTLDANTTIDSGTNALAAGPLTISSGVVLTVNGNLSVV